MVGDMGISMPGAGLIHSHAMTIGLRSPPVWSTGDGILQLLPTADALQKVYLNMHYTIARMKTRIRAKKQHYKWRFPFFTKIKM